MADLKQLVSNIEQWAEARNLIKGSTQEKQFLKLLEEFGELCGGISKGKLSVIKDSIGDCFVVLTILSAQRGKNEIRMVLSDFPTCITTTSKEYMIVELLRGLNTLGININRNVKKPELFFDILIDFICICSCFNFNLIDCVQAAWDEIKDRKGRMIDGVFVKEEDLQ